MIQESIYISDDLAVKILLASTKCINDIIAFQLKNGFCADCYNADLQKAMFQYMIYDVLNSPLLAYTLIDTEIALLLNCSGYLFTNTRQ